MQGLGQRFLFPLEHQLFSAPRLPPPFSLPPDAAGAAAASSIHLSHSAGCCARNDKETKRAQERTSESLDVLDSGSRAPPTLWRRRPRVKRCSRPGWSPGSGQASSGVAARVAVSEACPVSLLRRCLPPTVFVF